VRANTFKIILMVIDKSDNANQKSIIIQNLISNLQEINKEVTGSRSRHFENSLVHKVRQRIYQTYVVLLPVLQPQEAELIFSNLMKELEDHAQQNSVRQLIEWSSVILLVKYPLQLGPLLWASLAKVSNNKVTAVPSFLLILTHFLIWTDCPDPIQLDLAVQQIAPWCLSQQFATRLVAQVCFRKIWDFCINHNASSIIDKYLVLNDCIRRSVNPSNADKLTDDFYLSEFSPRDCLSLQDILYEFPRLSGMSDEIIPLCLIEKMPNTSVIPRASQSSALSSCHVKRRDGQSREKNSCSETGPNVQKKITPWTSMLGDSDIGGSSTRDSLEDQKRDHADLIVVASLVDKVPNLGGLARTCEVLGAGVLVLANKSVTKDKDFTAVSVTAENWLPMIECPVHQLIDYLKKKSSEGFSIVAVEQASESVTLGEYNFPKKTVLLLGREKEGVPVDLLNIVDVCVEIPQSGLIRSLNVHVTGAMVMWEYVRQHRTLS